MGEWSCQSSQRCNLLVAKLQWRSSNHPERVGEQDVPIIGQACSQSECYSSAGRLPCHPKRNSPKLSMRLIQCPGRMTDSIIHCFSCAKQGRKSNRFSIDVQERSTVFRMPWVYVNNRFIISHVAEEIAFSRDEAGVLGQVPGILIEWFLKWQTQKFAESNEVHVLHRTSIFNEETYWGDANQYLDSTYGQ